VKLEKVRLFDGARTAKIVIVRGAGAQIGARASRDNKRIAPGSCTSAGVGGRHCRGAMGIAGGQWRVETRVILSLSRRGRGTLIPARRRAFWPDGGPSCALLNSRVAAVFRRRCPRSCAPPTFSASPLARRSEGGAVMNALCVAERGSRSRRISDRIGDLLDCLSAWGSRREPCAGQIPSSRRGS
jgi:hypothetical protein